MAEANRPPGTKLLIDESYVKDQEDRVEEQQEKVELWKACVSHTTDFLEIIREHFDKFDELLKHVNDASDDIEFIVDSDENIKYRINESQES